ncbi:hypothetical protein AA101099_1312 [Neoasaia chiangmaiensis NBRC 101099]|uniref:exo-beta-N-acetylmuramidase NamZ family protein n=1 Tax=Neoasaia chiangmaiensis TaxID=320497 RepID=UPI00098AA526|nr:DUF1343 domain-containing protein [Neoasaia chiangmaiensis]GBR38715.1 hypothetical protein AA101099_1312 [Neoasaia chiangmaiensis NBRC 101099]GEN15771.1 hypothetical protein NCH01_22020 [Neoasaia chiangmaiensis]
MPDAAPLPNRRRFLAGSSATGLATLLPGAAEAAQKGVLTGFDLARRQGFPMLRHGPFGLIANPTSVDATGVHIADILHETAGVPLAAMFGPEHGFRGSAQAGKSEARSRDARTGLPVFDIYAKSGDALTAIFRAAGIGCVVFDIQDVGVRFYTYISTLFDSLVACARLGYEMIVLDRPNPITGLDCAGPVMQPGYESFIGRAAIPIRHGMTVGELARLFNAAFVPALAGRPARLRVVGMQGWSRDMWYDRTGLIWVPPSPNMPSLETAIVYPGTCLFEGTTLSVGRGTTMPFAYLGGPEVDGAAWVAALRRRALPGCVFRETYFTPGFSRHAGETIMGLELIVTDRQAFAPIPTALTMLSDALRLAGKPFWSDGGRTFDLLAGDGDTRAMLERGVAPERIVAGWQPALDRFRARRSGYLLYS